MLYLQDNVVLRHAGDQQLRQERRQGVVGENVHPSDPFREVQRRQVVQGPEHLREENERQHPIEEHPPPPPRNVHQEARDFGIPSTCVCQRDNMNGCTATVIITSAAKVHIRSPKHMDISSCTALNIRIHTYMGQR